MDEIIAEGGIPLKPGLAAFLAAVDALGLKKAVATSTARKRALYKLNLAGVPGTIETLAGGDEVARGKPAPDLFLLAAERLGVPPAECLAFDDSDPGVLAARAAGMRVVIIPDQKRPSAGSGRRRLADNPQFGSCGPKSSGVGDGRSLKIHNPELGADAVYYCGEG